MPVAASVTDEVCPPGRGVISHPIRGGGESSGVQEELDAGGGHEEDCGEREEPQAARRAGGIPTYKPGKPAAADGPVAYKLSSNENPIRPCRA